MCVKDPGVFAKITILPHTSFVIRKNQSVTSLQYLLPTAEGFAQTHFTGLQCRRLGCPKEYSLLVPGAGKSEVKGLAVSEPSFSGL